MKRRIKPNIRQRCRFYRYGRDLKDEDIVLSDYGEIKLKFSLFAIGLFAKEFPTKPIEIEEGNRTVAEEQFMLIGRWTKSLSQITHGMFCYILNEKKLFAVQGNATDKWGDKQNIYITIIDNVTKDITAQFPGSPL